MAEPENTPQPPRDERWERQIAASPPAAVPDELVLVLVRAYLAAIGCAKAADAEVDPDDQDVALRIDSAGLQLPERVV